MKRDHGDGIVDEESCILNRGGCIWSDLEAIWEQSGKHSVIFLGVIWEAFERPLMDQGLRNHLRIKSLHIATHFN